RGRNKAMGRVVWMVDPNGGRLPATFRLASLHLCALALIQLRFRGSFVPTTLRGEGDGQSAEILHACALNLNFSPERGSVSRSTSAVYGSQTNHQACLPKPGRREALVHRHAAAAHRAALQHTLPAGQACGEKSRLVHDRNQMAKLAVDVFGPGDGVCDFCTQEFTETLAEPMHRHLQ